MHWPTTKMKLAELQHYRDLIYYDGPLFSWFRGTDDVSYLVLFVDFWPTGLSQHEIMQKLSKLLSVDLSRLTELHTQWLKFKISPELAEKLELALNGGSKSELPTIMEAIRMSKDISFVWQLDIYRKHTQFIEVPIQISDFPSELQPAPDAQLFI